MAAPPAASRGQADAAAVFLHPAIRGAAHLVKSHRSLPGLLVLAVCVAALAALESAITRLLAPPEARYVLIDTMAGRHVAY
jgi:hypothetical protein